MKISLFKSQVIVSEHLRFELLFVPNYHLRFSPKKAKKNKKTPCSPRLDGNTIWQPLWKQKVRVSVARGGVRR